MRIPPVSIVVACLVAAVRLQAADPSEWDSQRIHGVFFTEGASAGDIDGDGHVDIVAGPVWFGGPDFEQSNEIAPAKSFPVTTYSDQFFSHVVDADGDSDLDVIAIGFPGKPARLYLNPGRDSATGHWPVSEITGPVDNESPAVIDLIPGGLPEIVCGSDSHYGYYQANADPTQPWAWNPVSRAGACAGRFAHGMGVGDVDGDGRLDLIDKSKWWRQPADIHSDEPWIVRSWAEESYGQGGAQICVGDVDGDGDADLVTSLNAHGYGLAWFEQLSDFRFVRHDILGASSLDNAYGIAFSQLHAVALRDIDGDGGLDIVTGKRWMAHQGKDVGGLQEPVLYWLRSQPGTLGLEFVPYQIDDSSGVGVEVLVADLNGDSRPDIVSSSKRGLSVHRQVDASQTEAGEALSNHRRYAAESWRIIDGRDQSKYADGLDPSEAASTMLVPDGFHVDLIASEPELTQPVAMCFDARGRIWVVEGHTYPTKAPSGSGRDRVLILEDSDGDGTFETRKEFIDGLNLVSGIEVGFGGVWIGAAPELLFVPDADSNDEPDSEPRVVLDGWGYHDTHETLNSFTWGPDGWLYGCQGVFTHSNVGKPEIPNDPEHTRDFDSPLSKADMQKRTPFNAGVWRYHPGRDEFEVFAHGTSNPWGVDFNDRGDWFISACVIPHLYHVVSGGRYQRQAGRHFHPFTYDDLKTIADHAHFAGDIRDHAYWGENKKTMPAAGLATSMVGGGHAHCGLAIYNGDAFPRQYQGDLLFHNLHGHRLVRERVDLNGSAYVGRHRPDFALAQDHQQIGVGVMVGPDGAVYTSDWHDPQTCHNRVPEVWNRTDGRIFRMRYGDVRPFRLNLYELSDKELVQQLRSDNGFLARQSQRILQERAIASRLDLIAVRADLFQMLREGKVQRDRLRALWTLAVIDGISEAELLGLLSDDDAYIRGWAIHLIGDQQGEPTSQAIEQIGALLQSESSLVVHRNAASLLQRLPVDMRMPVVRGLLANKMSSHDHNIPLLVWYGLEPLVAKSPRAIVSHIRSSGWQNLFRFAVRRTSDSPEGRDVLVDLLGEPGRHAEALMMMEELLASATRRGGVEMPSNWNRVFSQMSRSNQPRVVELARSIAVQFGDSRVLPHFRDVLRDDGLPASQRINALTALRTAKDGELSGILVPLLDDPAISRDAVSALAAFDDPAIADQILRRLASLDAKTRTAALNTLVSRKSFALNLVAAMERGEVDANEVPAFIVRQAIRLGDDTIAQRLEKVWGQISISSQDKTATYDRYRAMLRPAAVASADASRGRLLYEANCGNCHKLFGVGGNIGPDITGANRTSVDYWLENILEPNSLIGRGYQMTSLLTNSGQSISGIVQEENDDAITLQTATEIVVVPRDEIEISKLSSASLMPEGQLQPLSDQQVRNLFKYLLGPSQVPLPAAEQGAQKND